MVTSSDMVTSSAGVPVAAGDAAAVCRLIAAMRAAADTSKGVPAVLPPASSSVKRSASPVLKRYVSASLGILGIL